MQPLAVLQAQTAVNDPAAAPSLRRMARLVLMTAQGTPAPQSLGSRHLLVIK